MATRMTRVFLNHANSYHGKHIVRELLRLTGDGVANYKVYGTFAKLEEVDIDPLDTSLIEVLDSAAVDFYDQVLACDVMVYDVNHALSQIEEVCQVLARLRNAFEQFTNEKPAKKFFVLISTILTWHATKSNGEELTDVDYRKRRPHSCLQVHHRLEQQVAIFQNRFKDFIQSVVLCPGVTYGEGEETFHYLFKMAYMNQDDIKIFEPGNQWLPSIHVQDLAKCVTRIIDQWPDPTIRYICAVQPGCLRLSKFAETIVREVGGMDTRIISCAKELMPRLSQMVYLKLTLNLKLRSSYFEDSQFEFPGEDLTTFGRQVAKEFYERRKLGPVKVVIHGPPLSGKSTLAANLFEHYGVHIVAIPEVFEKISSELKKRVESAENYLQFATNLNGDPEDELSLFENLERVTSSIGKWKLDMEILKNLNWSDDELSEIEIQFLRNLLESVPYSQNQGYVIDGFAYKRKFAERLFLTKDGEGLNTTTKPDLVVVLSANDESLCNSAMELLDANATASGNTEAEFQRKMELYRDVSHEDESLFNFFLDHGILPVDFNVDETAPEEIFEQVRSILGEPKRYPRPKCEVEAERRQRERVAREKAKTEAKEKVVKLENMLDDRERRVQKWACDKIRAKREEIDMLEVHGLPARHYLLKQVLPCITDALLEVVRVRPPDPIDFLAEQLLKQHSIGQQILKSQNLNHKP